MAIIELVVKCFATTEAVRVDYSLLKIKVDEGLISMLVFANLNEFY